MSEGPRGKRRGFSRPPSDGESCRITHLKEREARIAAARKKADAAPKDQRAAYDVARVYASFDMQDQAFEWLEKARKLGLDDMKFVQEDPALVGLRRDPRFAKLVEGR